jgi:TatD DNase family protein
MRLYDTHAHVYAAEYGERTEELLASLAASGILINNIGTDRATSEACVGTARRYPNNVRAVVGLHPHEVEHERFDRDFYFDLAKLPEVVGVGECGLDYSRSADAAVKSSQLEVFRQHLEIARELGKALVIHCRASAGTEDAYEDLLAELRAHVTLPKFVVHSFTASADVCQKFVALGGYVAFNGILTFDKTGQLAAAVAACPLNRLLLETDSPYLAPIPFRGRQNEPSYVKYVAEKVAEIKKVSVEEVAEATTENALRLFV